VKPLNGEEMEASKSLFIEGSGDLKRKGDDSRPGAGEENKGGPGSKKSNLRGRVDW